MSLRKNAKTFYLKKSFNYYEHIYFSCFRLFFNSLIKRGLKIKMFNKMFNIKHLLKKYVSMDLYLFFMLTFLKIIPNVFLLFFRMGRVLTFIPLPILQHKQIIFTIKWFKDVLNKDKKGLRNNNIAELFYLTFWNRGLVFETKLKVLKLAITNRFMLKYLK